MEEINRNGGQGLGIAALIMGIISFVVAFIPCIGMLAIVTSVVAIVLGSIGLSQASRSGSQHKGLNTGGLVVGVIALFVAIIQIAIIIGIASNSGGVGNKVEKIINNIQKDVRREIEDGNLKITFDDGEDKIEITASKKREDLLDKLDKLEKQDSLTKKQDTLKKKEIVPDTTSK